MPRHHVRRGPAPGARSPRTLTTSASTAPTPAKSIWTQTGRFTGTDPDDGKTYDDNDIRVVADPGSDPDVVIAGPAGPLDAWLWRRGDDAELTISGGDHDTYVHFRHAVSYSID